MKNNEIKKNLKHGYIFLAIAALLVVAICICVEVYLEAHSQTIMSNFSSLIDGRK